MKRQYLGDSKDSFKWDYHHFLVTELGYRDLQIAWMMTEDDDGSDGGTAPERYPALPEILKFCNELRSSRDPGKLIRLPALTGASYTVTLYKTDEYLENTSRGSYFSGIARGTAQVLFLDPDKGFEPERTFTEQHIRYVEVEKILRLISPESVVTVFQHHRRKRFSDDLAGIRKRLDYGNTTAVCWRHVMFVTISSSAAAIDLVREINRRYADCRPVEVLD